MQLIAGAHARRQWASMADFFKHLTISRRQALAWGAAGSMGTLLGGCSKDAPPAVVPVQAGVSASTPTPTPTSSPPVPAPAPVVTVTQQLSGRVLVVAGDSIGYGTAAANYAAVEHAGFDASITIHNVSVPSRTMRTGFDRFCELTSFLDPNSTNVLFIQQGTNDLGDEAAAAADLYQRVATPFVASGKTAGFYVALGTVLPRGDIGWDSIKERERLAYNEAVRANAASADLIIDLARDPFVGDGISTIGSAYYADALHPTILGQRRLAVVYKAALQPLLDNLPRNSLFGCTRG
jgi:lysophospholipase L1-like esterase